jgi:hypothetical protein
VCELTVPGKPTGARRHYDRGDKGACDECREAEAEYRHLTRPGIGLLAHGHGREYWWWLWKTYRLRRHEYEAILARQGDVCAICESAFKPGSIHLDHDHMCDHQGKGSRSCADCVRGILCRRCNLALPVLDDAEWLKRAVAYLGKDYVAEILRESRLF